MFSIKRLIIIINFILIYVRYRVWNDRLLCWYLYLMIYYEITWCRGTRDVCGWMIGSEVIPTSGRVCAERGRDSIGVTGFGCRRSTFLLRACSISALLMVHTPATRFPKSRYAYVIQTQTSHRLAKLTMCSIAHPRSIQRETSLLVMYLI